MNLDAIKLFEGAPVSLQLKAPLANHGSSEVVELGEGATCGRASLLELTVLGPDGREQKTVQPLSVWSGTIFSVCDVGIVFDTLGYQDVPLRIFIPFDLIAGIFHAVQHVEPTQQKPSLVTLS